MCIGDADDADGRLRGESSLRRWTEGRKRGIERSEEVEDWRREELGASGDGIKRGGHVDVEDYRSARDR